MKPDHDILGDALEHLTPHAVEPRDWADVIRRAERGRGRRWVLHRLIPAAGLAVAATVLAILFVRLANPEEGALPAAEPLEFASLERPQTDADRAGGIGVIYAPKAGFVPESARLARRVPGSDFYVARNRTGDYCIVEFVLYNGVNGTCSSPGLLREVGAVRLEFAGNRSGLVPDGVTRVRSAGVERAVVNNVYVIDAGFAPIDLLTSVGWRPLGLEHGSPARPTFAIFNRDRNEPDVISGDTLAALTSVDGLVADSSRYVRDEGDTRYWMTGDGFTLCLVATPGRAGCGRIDQVTTDGGLVFQPRSVDLSFTRVVGIAPDGYTSATMGDMRTTISENVFIFPGGPVGDTVRLEGQAVPARSLALQPVQPRLATP